MMIRGDLTLRLLAGLLLASLAAPGCTEAIEDPALQGEIPFVPDRPSVGALGGTVEPYTGTDPAVLSAQERLRTGLDLHAKVIYRTCTPFGGVCHNRKEYPDLRTPANLIQAVNAPCNVQSGTPDSVYNRCERPGDRFQLGDGAKELEIAWLEYLPGEVEYGDEPPTETTPGLHLYLADPVGGDRASSYETGRFVRTFVNDDGLVQELPFFSFRSRWWITSSGAYGDRTHVFAEVRSYQFDQVQELLTVGVVQGDANRDGVFGARNGEPVPLIWPGNPEESYLVARLRGVMGPEDVPGSRMPLANQPLDTSEMLALYCWIEGLAGQAEVNLAAPIDYRACTYSADPENLNLLGKGVTWATRISKIIEFNCSGCHSGANAPEGLDLAAGNVYARLLGQSSQSPALALIAPFAPEQSYLWLKLIGDASIVGSPMPFNPLTGQGRLNQAELNDIKAWIEDGATENE